MTDNKANNNELVDLIRDTKETLINMRHSGVSHVIGKTTQVLQQLLDTVMGSKPGKTYYMLGMTFRQAHCIMQHYLVEMLRNRQIEFTSIVGEVRVNGCSIRFKSKRQYDTICKSCRAGREPKAFVDHTVLESIVYDGLNKIANELKSITGE